jgi:formate/nitrite transporter FocA (FNT family)
MVCSPGFTVSISVHHSSALSDTMPSSIDAYTAAEVTDFVARAGTVKGNMRLDKVFLSSVSAGCLLALACGTTMSTNASPWFQENAPGLIRTISALVFPYGLTLIILTGADLCTGSFMVCLAIYCYGLILTCTVYHSLRPPAPNIMVQDAPPLVHHILG